MVPETAEINSLVVRLRSAKEMEGANLMKIQKKINLRLSCLILALLLPSIFCVVWNGFLRASGKGTQALQYANTLALALLNNMQAAGIFEIMLILTMIAIIGTAIGIILSMRSVTNK